MDQATIDRCSELLGYHFKNPDLLSLALTHSSVAPTRLESNERLEFFGDAVLAVVVCKHLYDNHTDLQEGEMTKIKSSVVSRYTCAQIARELGICELLQLGKGMNESGGPPQSVAAAVFEAIIGAMYLDGGQEEASEFILRHIRLHIHQAIASGHQHNYKSLLQQYTQRRWGVTPEYHVLDEKGPDHSKCFEIGVMINGQHFRSAWDRSKKQAEQEAAYQALRELNVLK